MQQITNRDRPLLRAGVVVATLITLWMFGLLRGPLVVY